MALEHKTKTTDIRGKLVVDYGTLTTIMRNVNGNAQWTWEMAHVEMDGKRLFIPFVSQVT